MKICPHCGESIQSQENTCPSCHRELTAPESGIQPDSRQSVPAEPTEASVVSEESAAAEMPAPAEVSKSEEAQEPDEAPKSEEPQKPDEAQESDAPPAASAPASETAAPAAELRASAPARNPSRYILPPESPWTGLLLLPPILVLYLLGMSVIQGAYQRLMFGIYLPRFKNPHTVGWWIYLVAIALFVAMVWHVVYHIRVRLGYKQLLLNSPNEQHRTHIGLYEQYCKRANRFTCFLWVLPGFFLGLTLAVSFLSSYAYSVTLLNRWTFILPRMNSTLPYMLLSVLGILFILIRFFVSLNTTLQFRRMDLRIAAEFDASFRTFTAEEPSAAEADGEQTPAPLSDVSDSSNVPDAPAPARTFPTVGASLLGPLTDWDAAPAAPLTRLHTARNLGELCDLFHSFAAARGFDPDMASVRALFAALAATKVVCLRPADEASRVLAPLLTEFLTPNRPVAAVDETWISPRSLLYTGTESHETASDALVGLYRAVTDTDTLCVLTLTRADAGFAATYLQELLAYSESPERNYPMLLTSDRPSVSPAAAVFRAETPRQNRGLYLDLTPNIRVLALPASEGSVAAPAASYGLGSVMEIHLRGKACEPTAHETAEARLSYADFSRLIHDIPANSFLSEEQWKKFDRLEEFLFTRVGYRMDNRLARRLETFSSAALAAGGEVNEVLDAMLEAVILPRLAEWDPAVLQARDGKSGICEAMSLAFGTDNIPHTVKALQKLGFEA